MKKKAQHEKSSSLKTFFIYLSVVLTLITASLILKTASLIKESKYKGGHFILSISEKEKVIKFAIFNTEPNDISILRVSDNKVIKDDVFENFGILADGNMEISKDQDPNDIGIQMQEFLFYNHKNSNINLYDSLRFFLLSRTVAQKDMEKEEISINDETQDLDKKILSITSDKIVSKENISIQIINQTDVSGLGQMLERAFKNIGANVVSVTSSKNSNEKSIIEYAGEKTYTLERIGRLTGLPIEEVEDERIADITVKIGNDAKKYGIIF